MVFKLYGLIRWKGKKIANGIDGRFETKDERIINILRQKGIEEIKEKPKKETEKKPETKVKRGRSAKNNTRRTAKNS